MTCQEVHEYLDRTSPRGSAGLPEVLRKHLEQCECCRRLWSLLSRRPSPRPVPESVRSRIEQNVLRSLEPVKPLPNPGKLTAGFALVFVGFSALFGGFLAASAAPGLTTLSSILFIGVTAVAALLLASLLSREMVPGQKRPLRPSAAQAGVLLGLFVGAAIVFPWHTDEPLLAGSWKCFRVGFLLSLPAAALALLLLRRGAVFSPQVVGAGAGLLAGLVGVVSLQLSCPTIGAPHIALGHLMIPVVGALIGYVAGRLMPVRWSARKTTDSTSISLEA